MRKISPEILMALALCLTLTLVCTAEPADPPPAAVIARAPDILPPAPGFDERTEVALSVDGELRELRLHDYLIGVLMAELPGDFAPEAMKAQAVASRTFALYCRKHGDADVCADSACCQAWREAEPGDAAYAAAKAAVEATDGIALYFGGSLIDATYFSCSGGMTEDAVSVWGTEVPYLRSVESPGEEGAACYHTQESFSPEEFAGKLPQAGLSGAPENWLGAVRTSTGGGVAELVIGGRTYTGAELRRAFSLRSARFTLNYEDGRFVFDVLGSGHRVGMSQYGAQAMAERGASYDEILTTYYTGVELAPAGE